MCKEDCKEYKEIAGDNPQCKYFNGDKDNIWQVAFCNEVCELHPRRID